jgi:hypothetical protein
MWLCSRLGLDYSPEKRKLNWGNYLKEAVSSAGELPLEGRDLQQALLSS